MRFSWRIKNPTVMWTSSISEVGRSLQTPRLGERADQSSDHTYKVVLTIPEDFQNEIESENLVIQLAMDMKKEDEVAFSTSYILDRDHLNTWVESDAYCKRKGGLLASIHSLDQQALAKKAADGNYVWLGGSRRKNAEWRWSDNSTWDFKGKDFGKGNPKKGGKYQNS